MRAISFIPFAPKLQWRLATFLGLWFMIFGIIIAITPLHMEAGYDVAQEKLMAALISPLYGWLGLSYLLGGPRPSLIACVLSLLVILGPTIMLFRCRSLCAFWMLTTAHIILIASASFGYSKLLPYWNAGS